MIDKDLKESILKSIATSGSSDANIDKNIINGNIQHILNTSSGLPKIYNHILKRFKIVLSQPLPDWNPFQIRCALCRRVISYPCWYYSVNYTHNHFHYFVCFDKDSPNKPSMKCYKKG